MEREKFYEKLRGIAIIMVVLIHTIPTNTDYLISLRQIFNLAVPVFLFLSGYFIKESKVLEDSKGFLIKRMERILIPYIFWSIFVIVTVHLKNGININGIIISLITGQTLGPYYFIIVILQLILITPIMVRLDKLKVGKIALWILTPLALLTLYYINLFSDFTFSFYSLSFPLWFIFYYYGFKVGNDRNIELKVSKNSVLNGIIYVSFLGLSMIEGYIINENFGQIGFAVSQIKITSYLASISFINFAFSIKNQINNNMEFLSTIGDVSYGIFFIHMIVILFVNQFIEIIHIESFIPIIWFMIGLFGSMLVILIARKIFGNKFSRKYFGF